MVEISVAQFVAGSMGGGGEGAYLLSGKLSFGKMSFMRVSNFAGE